MSIDQFWTIIDAVHVASGRDVARKCELLKRELRRLSPEEFLSFDEHFGNCYVRAYSWDLWGAAYLICGGCGDDCFMDFRSSLICMGRKLFENAMADPDSLADADIDADERLATQQYSIAIGHVCEERHDELEAVRATQPKEPVESHPRKPSGEKFKEWEMSSRYPRLAAKYHHDDSQYLDYKAADERRRKKLTYVLNTLEGERLFWGFFPEMLLDTGIIPSLGVIPPFSVVAAVIRNGYFIHSPELWFTWQPWELQQGQYYGALVVLERFKAEDFERMRLKIDRETLLEDYTMPPTDDYSEWLQSLKPRGLVT